MIVGLSWEAALVAANAGGAIALVGGAFALGLRHGIDWDHIAAITDITSTTAPVIGEQEAQLTREPGLMFTDEGHHRLATPTARQTAQIGLGARVAGRAVAVLPAPARAWMVQQQEPVLLGTLYALGHAAVVTGLGLLALLTSRFLPEWIDPIMGRIVGVTLLFLAAYLYYSIYRFFRGGEFRIRSRWMLIFAGVRNAYRWVQAKLHGHDHHTIAHAEQYGRRTAFGIGLIHGVGAETGTQVLVIATAVGAGSTLAGVTALLAFVVGLVLSNSVVVFATATGFVSASRRQWLYVGAGFFAATFSLVLGLLFIGAQEGVLPNLEPYLRWIGGPA